MRPYECSLTSAGRQTALESLVAAGHPVRIRRTKCAGAAKEEWRIGSLVRNEWCVLEEREARRWRVVFGGNFKLPVILESVLAKVIGEERDCSWVWSEKAPDQSPEPMPLKRHGSS